MLHVAKVKTGKSLDFFFSVVEITTNKAYHYSLPHGHSPQAYIKP